MDAVLIYKDTKRIASAQATLVKIVEFTQNVYDAFLEIGVDVTLDDLKTLIFSIRNPQTSCEAVIKGFVTNFFLNKAGTPEFNGVPIKRSELGKLIDIPDLAGVVSVISEFDRYETYEDKFNPALLEISDDEVSKTETADSELDAKFTYYTQNDRGAEIATKLFEMCEALNYLQSYLKLNYANQVLDGKLIGIEHHNIFRPKLHFIREQESRFPDYVAN